MAIMPPPGSRNEKGEPIDVIKYIQAKREIAEAFLPGLHDMLREAVLLEPEFAEEARPLLEAIDKIAALYKIDLNPNWPE